MATSYAWHPGAPCIEQYWPLTPPLFADEIFSSWLIRTALRHGCSPQTLTDVVWRRARVWLQDIDRGLDEPNLQPLAKASGIPLEAITLSTLRPVISAITGNVHPTLSAVLPWVLVLGSRGRFHAAGLQFCPECMRQSEPHYRIQQRLAWHCACEVHGLQLVDHCSLCSAVVQPALLRPGKRISQCHHCGKALGITIGRPAVVPALELQQTIDAAHGGMMRYGDHPMSFRDWMMIARVMVSFLRTAARHPSANMRRFCSDIGIDLGSVRSNSLGLPFEYLGPGARAELLANVWVIMGLGPERFMAVAEQALLPSSCLQVPVAGAPTLLAQMSSALISHSCKARARGAHEQIRTPQQVLRIWAHLQRRIRRHDLT